MKKGKQVSTHPLHETFLGLEWKDKKLRDEYYQRTEPVRWSPNWIMCLMTGDLKSRMPRTVSDGANSIE